jgi:catechol 2,3-dioxygenase
VTTTAAAHPGVAQLAHVPLFTPRPDATLHFFKDLLGMQESARAGQSGYLRAYEDHYHHTLKITESAQPGLGHIAWRTASSEALQRCAERLQADGQGDGWTEGDLGYGPAFRLRTPDGHPMGSSGRLAAGALQMTRRPRCSTAPSAGPTQGVPVRRIDHVKCYADDVAGSGSSPTNSGSR